MIASAGAPGTVRFRENSTNGRSMPDDESRSPYPQRPCEIVRPVTENSSGDEHLPPPETDRPRFRLALLLLLVTFATTLWAGSLWHVSFMLGNGHSAPDTAGPFGWPDPLLGIPYSISVLAILMAHEMGHYLACRYYGIRTTLPYAIPAPVPFPFGTMGAVIRIKSPFRDRRQLFDVGIAGPLAGFVLIVPALIIGLGYSTDFTPRDPVGTTYEFGEPLLFRLAAELFIPAGEDWNINLHPIGWAAWFGMLATGMNLLPIGQLDGGHVVYALLGHRIHRTVSYAALCGLVVLGIWCFFGYLCFAVILLFMGLRHPPTSVPTGPLDRRRVLAAVAGLLLLILTFIPTPVRMI